MEKNKLNLILFVADKLSAAPEGTAKADLVEELSDNLYQRYVDLTAAGVPEEEALQRAKDDLGDVGELVDYLKGLEPDQPLPGEKSATSQLDDVLRDVEELCRTAMGRAKSAIQEAKETMAESGIGRWSWKSEDGKVEVSVNHDDPCPGEGEEPREPAGETQAQDCGPSAERGRNISAEVGKAVKEAMGAAKAVVHSDAVQGAIRTTKGVVKDAMHAMKDAVNSVGAHGKAEAAGAGESVSNQEFGEPGRESADDSAEKVPGGELRGIDVQTGAGNITIRVSRFDDGDVIVGGDIEDLEVTRREDGVLVIRQGRTASSSFLFGRGVGSADVELDLPLRDWDLLNVATGNGDISLDLEGICLGKAVIRTGAGDVQGSMPFVSDLTVKSASGDIDWHGNAGILQCESASGDVNFYGVADTANVRSFSGDVSMEGSFPAVQCSSISGDVRLTTQVLPDQLDATSTSGDCWVRIPDAGGFLVNFKTTSGRFSSDFFVGNMGSKNNTFTYQGGGPIYNIKSISGSLYLNKL